MWILYSTIQYEGDTFHGIFNSIKDAEKAKRKLEEADYDTQGFYIEFCTVGTIMVGFEETFEEYSRTG